MREGGANPRGEGEGEGGRAEIVIAGADCIEQFGGLLPPPPLSLRGDNLEQKKKEVEERD